MPEGGDSNSKQQAQGVEGGAGVREPAPLAELLLDYCCDSVEACPIEGLRDVFAVGNYELLDREKQEKTGRVLLYRAFEQRAHSSENFPSAEASKEASKPPMALNYVSSVDTGAVFDLRWAPVTVHGEVLLGQATADGSLHLYTCQEQGSDGDKSSSLVLKNVASTSIEEGKSLLSLDWDRGESHSIVASSNNGKCYVWNVDDKFGLVESTSWKAHEFETWIAAFDCFHHNIVYSGADDCVLKAWDVKSSPYGRPIFQKKYEMGCTVVASNPHIENLLAVGSYDETVRVYDTRQMAKPLLLAEHGMGGGVWRLRWHPSPALPGLLLAGCMDAGFHVLDATQVADTMRDKTGSGQEGEEEEEKRGGVEEEQKDGQDAKEMVRKASYLNHKSLAYGCDWGRAAALGGIVVSCSFYDKKLDMWKAL